MNWGRKKKTSASSMPRSGMSSISKMFPISWISKLRQGNENEDERKSETRRIGGRKVKYVKKNEGLQEEEKSRRVEKFYGETDENFWRLSFSDECVHGRKSVGGCPESLSYDWLDEPEFSPSALTCRSCGAKGVSKSVKESKCIDFNDMLLDMRKTKDSNPQVDAKSRTDELITREPTEIKVTRDGKLKNLDLGKCAKLKGTYKKVAEGNPTVQNLGVKDIVGVEAAKQPQAFIKISRRSPSSLSSQQHQNLEASTNSKLQSSECKYLGEINLAELSLGAGEERKSIYINKDSLKRRSKSGRSSKLKVYSPRTPSKAELCKIRALEDLKKTRMKMRVKEKEEQEKAMLESLAVVKRSFDPQRDFRNSMLEMILDKGMIQPEELEELLACYLILNSDEYHDMIIKVFRQVWFDLNKDCPDPPTDTQISS